MVKLMLRVQFLVLAVILQLSVRARAFIEIEQVMSYQEKYQTSIGLFSASGKFQETHDELEMELNGVGMFGEVNLRRSPWMLRVDTFSAERETQSGALLVKNTFREFRTWGLGITELGDIFSLYGGLGAGILFPETTMTALGNSKSLTSKSSTLGGFLLGMRWRLPVGVFFDLWSQTIYTSVYPNGNVSSFVMALGYQF